MDPRGTISLEEAVDRLRAGGALAFATETVIGLGADATNPAAVERVYTIKGRPDEKPMPVIVADIAMAETVTDGLTGRARRLAEAFWPGPLTLVCPALDNLPEIVTAGGDTIALRAPGLASLRVLIRALGSPLIAPSANKSGDDPARSFEALRDIFAPELSAGDLAIYRPDDEKTARLEPSTIIIPGEFPGEDRILREGPIATKDLSEIS